MDVVGPMASLWKETDISSSLFVSFHAFLFRLSSDPKKAIALGHVLELAADGTVNSTDITLNVQSP